jgi:hypothetical protein
MPFSPSTTELLAALDSFSSGRLTRRDDLGTLLEAAGAGGAMGTFDELCFLAKFAHRTHLIMRRIGKDGTGYGSLQQEFTGAITRCHALAGSVLEGAPEVAREQFARRYLELSPAALGEFLALCYDLSWYKNWNIDRRGEPPPPRPRSNRTP